MPQSPFLKGQCHEIFCFWFFFMNQFPPSPWVYTIRAVSNFSENSQRYLQLKVDHQCQRHRWQTMRLISGWGYLKVNLKAKIYVYVNSTIQRCPNKIIKMFLIADFFHLPPVSATPVVNLELRISPVLMGYSGAGGKLIHKKTRSKKSRDTVPLTLFVLWECVPEVKGEDLNDHVLTLFVLWECLPEVKGKCLNDPVLTLFVLWECVPEVEGECLNDLVLTLFFLWECVPEAEGEDLKHPVLALF